MKNYQLNDENAMLTLRVILTIAATLIGTSQLAAQEAQSGVFDLTSRDLESEVIKLDGSWLYYFGRHVSPEEIKSGLQADGEFETPGYWTTQERFINSSDPQRQLVTYMFVVLVKPSEETLTLHVPEIPSAYKLFINGKLKYENGKIGVDEDSTVPGGRHQSIDFAGKNLSRFEFVMQVSNFNHVTPGIWYPVTIAQSRTLYESLRSLDLQTSFFIGWLLIMGIYHVILFLLRQQSKAPLFFGLYCLAVSIRVGVVGGDGFWIYLFEGLDWHWIKRLEYFSFYWAATPFLYFCWHLFPKDMYKWLVDLNLGVVILASILTLVAPTQVFNQVMPFYQVFIALGATIILGATIKAVVKKRSGAELLLFGFIIIFIGLFNDILYAKGVLNTGESVQFAVGAFTLCQAYLIAKLFSNAFTQVEEGEKKITKLNQELIKFNEDLEDQVELKTREVRSLLDHIPQGVLSIGDDGVIGDNCSAHLFDVLEQDVRGKTFREGVLDNVVMNSDKKDQAWQTILSCIGEDELNFETNDDKLPLEMVYQVGDREKHIKATWNIDSREGTVDSILVTMLDVTQEKILEKEAENQRQEIMKLQQLVRVPESKAEQFFNTSKLLLDEIKEKLEASTGVPSKEVMRLIFVNAHTVKGAARTLHLSQLAEVIHDFESLCTVCIQKEDLDSLNRVIEQQGIVMATFDEYKRVNVEELNRDIDGHRLNISRNFVEEQYYLINNFLNDPTEGNFIKEFKDQNQALAKLIFEELPDVFEGYKERAIKIAVDLGKAQPQFDFKIPQVSVTTDQRSLLDKCMIHLIRNSLDHGIESPSDRGLFSKPEHGELKIEGTVDQGFLHIYISDDGRGLAIQTLKERGIANGRLTESSPNREIAETIFESGVSTASSITDISGRGVGMDAVKTFLQMEGGDIEIILGEEVPYDPGFYRFRFHLKMPYKIRAIA